MVNFFGSSSSRRRSNHQGFRKYNSELSDYQRNVAGVPNNGFDKDQSMSSSAGSAAMAALRLHQNSSPVDTDFAPPTNNVNRAYSLRSNSLRANTSGRTNSLTNSMLKSSANRSNSLRTYSYHPKGSYTPGQATIPNSQRYSSLNSGSNVAQFSNNIQRSPVKPRHSSSLATPVDRQSKRLSSINSNASGSAAAAAAAAIGGAPKRNTTFTEEDELPGDEHEEPGTVTTTSTTKVVDGQGRLLSITTKTIKTLPNGSNIIETTTKNISRSGSRANSLRNNSILSSSRDPNYNLTKIDEDLQDFEYDYELDNEAELTGHQVSQESYTHHEFRDPQQLSNDLMYNSSSLKLNTDQGSARASSMNSAKQPHDGSPVKPLKSILKSSVRHTAEDVPREEEPTHDIHDEPEYKVAKKSDESSHPYKVIGSPLTNPPAIKVPEVPTNRVSSRSKQSPKLVSPGGRFSSDVAPSPENSVTSPISSIKFDDNVETIPIYQEESKTSGVTATNQDLYNKALEVAMEKVYGNRAAESSQGFQRQQEPKSPVIDVPESTIENKSKLDKKLEILGHSGINDNYKYENHHKDFAMHSFRENNGNDIKGSTRKDRAKEAKKQQKDTEKQLKAEEKQKKLEAKKQAKLEAQQKKQNSPKRGFFGRKKKDNSDLSTLGSSTYNEEEKSLTSVSPVSNRLTHELQPGDRQLGSPQRNTFVSSPRGQQSDPQPKAIEPLPVTPELQSGAVLGSQEVGGVQSTPQIEPTISLEPEDQAQSQPDVKVSRAPPASHDPAKSVESPPFKVPSPKSPALKSPATTSISNDNIGTKEIGFDSSVATPTSGLSETRNVELPPIGVDLTPSADTVTVPESPQTPERLRPFIPELAKSDSSPRDIPRPKLSDVIEDTEEDEGILSSEYEDGEEGTGMLNSPVSKRSDAYEQFYEAECGFDESPTKLKDVDDGKSDELTISGVDEQATGATPHTEESEPSRSDEILTPKEKVIVEENQALEERIEPETIPVIQIPKEEIEDSLKGAEGDADEKVVENEPVAPATNNSSPVSERKRAPFNASIPRVEGMALNGTSNEKPIDITKQYTLAELIRMGKEDVTEDSFAEPDAAYDSDSDVSSRFSADLNAALRRITDDKDTQGNSSIFASPEKQDGEAGEQIDLRSPDVPSARSALPTDSGDDRSPQPSRSTIATKDVKPPEVDHGIIVDVNDGKGKVKEGKPKKKSKFKDKIIKYFVNKYD